MRKLKGLTRVDVAVALSCLVLLLAQAAILNAGGRERSKKEVCLANLKMLAAAWQTYSGDNKDKIPVGDIGYSWTFPTGSSGGPQRAWVEFPHRIPHSMPPTTATNGFAGEYQYDTPIPQAVWEHAIAEGTMWKYVGDYSIYRCPDGDKGSYVTYSMSHSMNTYPGSGGTGSMTITNTNQIAKPSEQFVFLDTGTMKQGAFFVKYTDAKWYDLPPMRHGQGTNFVFADGHAIYRKWTDPHTIEATKHGWGGTGWSNGVDYCDCDLRWMVKVTWGSVPYTCTNPAKNCEY
jgi:prepilin-type processing-associated H-X9-DG protein